MYCDDRCKQSERIATYMTNNPSNHVNGVQSCIEVPGLVCKPLHVKNQVDTETVLLRGSQSVAVEPEHSMTPESSPVETTSFSTLPPSFWAETTRVSKACNSETDITERLDTPHPIQWGDLPYVNNSDLFGKNSRNIAKYGQK